MNDFQKPKINLQKLKPVLCPLLWTILLIALLIIAAAFVWVIIPEDNTLSFWQALRKILRNIKDCEALLLAIVVTIFFQNYMNMKAEEKEKAEKIKKIGHYAIELTRDKPWPISKDAQMIRLIGNDEELKNPLPEGFAGFGLRFISSKGTTAHLRNIMAFEAAYFKSRKKEILANYMNVYQGVEYASPAFVSADSYYTKNHKNIEGCISSEVLFVMQADKAEIRNFWISAVTEEGFLYFISVKAKLTEEKKEKCYKLTLLQQTNHFVQNKELVPLA
ncbi:MAG: hypothetical protein NC412_07275 [Roseburia sp.]|nr:hypothetical protein [Roseburia sp.]MCM1277641.1 hypothetical protein [Robinsoniella sp.]